MTLRILYHGNCFDGVSSAAIFTKFYQAKINPGAEVSYTPTMHRAGNAFDEDQFDGDENAIVDFKYCADERLTWWFDHHQSAFLSKEDEQHFLADKNGKKFLDLGLQIAAGVPLQCDEPEDFQTFRLGLFGLDKLHNIDRTVEHLSNALDQILS